MDESRPRHECPSRSEREDASRGVGLRSAKADYAKGHDGQSMPYLPDARTEPRSPDQRPVLNYFSDRQ